MSNVIPFKRSAAKPHASRCDVCGLRHPNDIVYKLHRRFKFRKVDTSTICGIEILYRCPQCKEEYSVLYGRAEE